jgi:hypothetical protein
MVQTSDATGQNSEADLMPVHGHLAAVSIAMSLAEASARRPGEAEITENRKTVYTRGRPLEESGRARV